jgi:transposase
MEACGSANHWARELKKLGHEVRLIRPQFVKPYVKSNKNDIADAEAICEAVSRPNMRFAPMKELEHQDIQSIHRARSLLVKQRTAVANQIRGLMAEYGVVVAQAGSSGHPGIPCSGQFGTPRNSMESG